MSLRTVKRALVIAMLASPLQTCAAAEKGSCLESSRALRNDKSTYTWCPGGWKETRDGDAVTFRCQATSTARSYKPGSKGGEYLSIAANRDSADKCK